MPSSKEGRAERYRSHAADLRELAAKTASTGAKDEYLRLAGEFDMLAEETLARDGPSA